jgi:hypothetical protein
MCDCVEKVNEKLKEMNTYVHRELMMNFKTGKGRLSQPMVVTRQIDSKNKKMKARTLLCAFCPFCGKSYDDEKKPKKSKRTTNQRSEQ